MFQKVLICGIITTFMCIQTDAQYRVPKPRIEVMKPRGLRVSIPDEEGIQLFAFHGNVNQKMRNLEAGQMSRDILTKEDGRWTFEEENLRLEKGDTIYYWLFVINNNLGYRYDEGVFHVNGSTSLVEEEQPGKDFDLDVRDNKPISENDESMNIKKRCVNALYNLTETVKYVRKELEILSEINELLFEIAGKTETISNELKLTGVLPQHDDPVFVAQTILNEKLGLRVTVVTATRNKANRSINFTVGSMEDKVAVIRAAKEKLKNSKISLSY